jgi:hypothetical protein
MLRPATDPQPTHSVIEMATMLGFTKQQFRNLRKKQVFPEPLIHNGSSCYTDEQRVECLRIRATGTGANGKKVRFYRTPSAPRLTAPVKPSRITKNFTKLTEHQQARMVARRMYRLAQKVVDAFCGKKSSWRLDFSTCLDRLNENLADKTFIEAVLGEGEIHKETWVSICRVIDHLINKRSRGVSIFGLIQTAKTHTQAMGVLISALIKTIQGPSGEDGEFLQYCHPIFFTPNGTKYLGQYVAKTKDAIHVFKNLKVVCGDKSMTLEAFLGCLQHDRNNRIAQCVHEEGLSRKIIRQNQDYVGFLTLASSNKNKQLFAAFLRSHPETRFIIVRDESHHSAAQGSVQDEILMMKETPIDVALRQERESIYDMVNKVGAENRCQFVSASATNWGGLRLERVHVQINKWYCGFDFAYKVKDENGIERIHKVSEGVRFKMPKITSLGQLADACKCEDIRHIRPIWYLNIGKFTKANERYELGYSSHEEYQKRCMKAIAKCIRYFLFDNNAKNHDGMLVRFLNNNAVMSRFLEEIKPLLPAEVKIIKMFDEINTPSVKSLLRMEGVKLGDKYIVFATAKARMSDTFPINCGYGLDFTHASATLTALLQGVMGRMFGYYKDPIIVLSEYNYDWVQRYIENGFLAVPGKPILGDMRVVSDFRNAVRFEPDGDSRMSAIFDRIQNQVIDQSVRAGHFRKFGEKSKGCIGLLLGSNLEVDFYNDILHHGDIEYLESKANTPLLRPGDISELNDVVKTHGQGYTHFVSRTEGPGLSDKAGGKDYHKEIDGDKTIIYRSVVIRVRNYRVGRSPWRLKAVGFDLPISRKIGEIDSNNNSLMTKFDTPARG